MCVKRNVERGKKLENATHFIVFDIERNFRPYKSEDPSEIVDIEL